MRTLKIPAKAESAVFVHSGDGRIILQVRRLVHDAVDPLAASFKSAVELDQVGALRLAGELLAVVHQHGPECVG